MTVALIAAFWYKDEVNSSINSIKSDTAFVTSGHTALEDNLSDLRERTRSIELHTYRTQIEHALCAIEKKFPLSSPRFIRTNNDGSFLFSYYTQSDDKETIIATVTTTSKATSTQPSQYSVTFTYPSK